MKTAVAYARFSSAMQREESIDAQLRAITDYCAKNDIALIGHYIDMAQSATTDDRPEFQRMIAESAERDYDYIIVHKLDRFARNRYDSAIYSKKIEDNGKRLLSVLEKFGDGPEAVIFRSIIEGFNEYYSKNLGRETRKGHRENAYKALFNGGTPPLGYDIDEGNQYIINEYEAEAVRLIFSMYIDGYSYLEIIDRLNNLGYRTKKGGLFKKTSLTEILRQEKYIGRYVFGKTDYRPGEPRNTHRYANEEDMIIIDDAIPAILSKEVWTMARQRREKRKQVPSARRNTTRSGGYPLTGHLYCKHCGSPMVGSSRTGGSGKRYYYYECTAKSRGECNARGIRADKLEALLFDALDDYLFGHHYIDNMVEALFNYLSEEKEDPREDEKKELKKKIADAGKKIENITSAIASGTTSQALLDKLTALETEKAQLESTLRESDLKQTHIALLRDEVEDFVRKYDSIKKYDRQERSKLMSIFVDRIEVDTPRVYVTFNVSANDINRERLSGAEKGT